MGEGGKGEGESREKGDGKREEGGGSEKGIGRRERKKERKIHL